jgi:hypothetical protein
MNANKSKRCRDFPFVGGACVHLTSGAAFISSAYAGWHIAEKQMLSIPSQNGVILRMLVKFLGC